MFVSGLPVRVSICVSICVCVRGEDVFKGIKYDKDRDRLWVVGVCVCLCMFVCLSVSLREENMFSTVSHTKNIGFVSGTPVHMSFCVYVFVCVCARGEHILNFIAHAFIAHDKDRGRLWVIGVCVFLRAHVFLSVSLRKEKMFSTVSHTTKIVIISGLLVCVSICVCICFCLYLHARRRWSQLCRI